MSVFLLSLRRTTCILVKFMVVNFKIITSGDYFDVYFHMKYILYMFLPKFFSDAGVFGD